MPLPHRLTLAAFLAAACLLGSPSAASPQSPAELRRSVWLTATPIGALPPSAMPMPASRNHNYWGVRLLSGVGRGGSQQDPFTVAGGIDFQWQGGSVFGATAGYQTRDCEPAGFECADHALLEARARFNVMTGSSRIGALLGDNSATATLGTEIAFGYAPGALPDDDVCTVDVGVPISLAMLQGVRIVTFVSPGLLWEMGCAGGGPSRPSFLAGAGVGIQQLGGRALDLHFGARRILRTATGTRFGVTLSYFRLP